MSTTTNRPAITPEFTALVERHLRTMSDPSIVLSSEEMAVLRADPEAWWTDLNMKRRAVETQLGARNMEEDPGLDFVKWRSSALRFKNYLDQVLAEVGLLMRRNNQRFFESLLAEERNALADRVRDLEIGIQKILDGAPLTDLKDLLDNSTPVR